MGVNDFEDRLNERDEGEEENEEKNRTSIDPSKLSDDPKIRKQQIFEKLGGKGNYEDLVQRKIQEIFRRKERSN